MPDKKDREMWWAFLSGKPESEWVPSKKSKGKAKQQYPPSSYGMRAWADEPRHEPVHDSWQNNDEGEVEQVLMVDPAETLPSPVGTPVPLEYLEEMMQPSTGKSGAPFPSAHLIPREPTTLLLKLIDEVSLLASLSSYITEYI